ncbi:hypothetical protein N7539_003056 [Penicillium diatomitis]|uniref:Uncharacterized protein n=1 Tax=Penicillium diatomitis TaxID=2819901 RepID=A0A9X0BZG3_9EURO|nr:uncharacterized protein N7539_003056 [Penicillium diatomitis]KAJ5491489.1 hypothetical protein N7539_003056 [Penicillium diatomitis]
MPIKLPKGFARRKSSGNVLEDVDGQSQSTFRVFERPGATPRSMTDDALTKRMSEGNAIAEDPDNIFAGAEHPMNHTRYARPRTVESLKDRLTGRRNSGPNYESSTSTRQSTSSTVPSSTEIPSSDGSSSPHTRIHDVPAPPPLAGALRAAGRTFSFGGRFSRSSANPGSPRHGKHDVPPEMPKPRAYSGSTDDTATPPRLPDAQLNFDLASGGDDFGKMFDHLGQGQNASMRDPSPQATSPYSSSPPKQSAPDFQEGRAGRPAPIKTDRTAQVEPSQYSWDSRHSGDNLLHSPNHDVTPPVPNGARRPSPSPAQMLGATTSHRALARTDRQPSDGLRRSGYYPAEQETSAVEDDDAKMVLSSMPWAKGTSQWEDATPSPSGETPLLDKGKSTSPGAGPLSPNIDDNMFAARYSPAPKKNELDDVRLAVQFADNYPKQSTSPGNKVMTPSQFEHYRQQQELRRSNSNATRSEDESEQEEEFDDEEDEREKQRAAERQRRKQEAHLSLYRQQMQKVTGQQSPSPLLRPETSSASNSTPNLHLRPSIPGEKSSSGKSSNEEEDEEVPLGILAAHGFPNRNRPPTRLANASSHPNLRASMHPFASSSSSLAGADAGHRGSLPVFARNLPQDPYFGSRIVNPTNREPLALGGGASSVYGGPPSPAPHPPGGLVGVIAHEERSRAARRAGGGGGSPNPLAMYEQMQIGMGSPHGVPRPYTMMGQPAPVTPSEQASINLSNQMQNMVQMQMQWMGQMMQMQGMQGMQGMPGMGGAPMMMPGAMPPPMMGSMPMQGTPMGPPMVPGRPMSSAQSTANLNHLRPMSMQGQGAPMGYDQQRTMSMVDPNIAARRGSPLPNLAGGPPFRPSTAGYAASIAPSERSNAGLASRYRPVSVMAGEPGPGPAPPSKAWNNENRHHSPTIPISQPQNKLPKSSSLATVTVRPVSRTSQSPPGRKAADHEDEENDDEGWAEMMKRREKKKSGWKLKRGTSSIGDLLSAVH